MISSDMTDRKLNTRACLLGAALLLLCIFSVCFLFRRRAEKESSLTACIYQDGTLLKTIDLADVTSPYSFTVTAPDGGSNTIEVRPGSIGITEADCPDKLCVTMGFADSSLLPIVCLPHALVIRIESTDESGTDAVDIITY